MAAMALADNAGAMASALPRGGFHDGPAVNSGWHHTRR